MSIVETKLTRIHFSSDREPVISSTYEQAGEGQGEEDFRVVPPTFRTQSTHEQSLFHQPRGFTFGNSFQQQRSRPTFKNSPFSFRTENVAVLPTPNFNSFFSNQLASFKQEFDFPLSQIHPPSVMSNIEAFSTNSAMRDSESSICLLMDSFNNLMSLTDVGAISSFSFFRPGNKRY